LIHHSLGNKGLLLAVDEDLENPFVDMDDVTGVFAERNNM